MGNIYYRRYNFKEFIDKNSFYSFTNSNIINLLNLLRTTTGGTLCGAVSVDEDGGKVDLVVAVVLVLQQHHVLVLDGGDLPAGVRPDLGAAHVDRDDQEDQADPRPPVHQTEAEGVLGPHEAEEESEDLKEGHGDDHHLDGGGVHLVVDLAPGVDEGQVVLVHEVLEEEVDEAEGSDEGAGHGEHDDHGEDQHHPGVLVSEPELVLDGLPDGGSVGLAPGDADLEEVVEDLAEPDELQTGADEGGGDDVVDEEGPAIREEDALPVKVPVPDKVVEVRVRGGEAKCGEDDDHEEEIPEGLLHDGMVLPRPGPVPHQQVRPADQNLVSR